MFERIVVLLDGSEAAEGAVDPACAIARRVGGKIILLHSIVTEPRLITHVGYGVIWPDKSIAQLEQEGRDYLEAIRVRLHDPDIVLGIHKAQVDLPHTIKHAVATANPDLLVVSPKTQSRLDAWLRGNTIAGMLHAASCPLLIVHPKQEFRKILVALCLSQRSDAVKSAAAQIGYCLGDQVTLCDTLGMENLFPREGANRSPAKRRNVSDQFLQFASQLRPDLVIVLSDKKAGTRRWPLGTAAEEVFRAMPCSLLIMPCTRAGMCA